MPTPRIRTRPCDRRHKGKKGSDSPVSRSICTGTFKLWPAVIASLSLAPVHVSPICNSSCKDLYHYRLYTITTIPRPSSCSHASCLTYQKYCSNCKLVFLNHFHHRGSQKNVLLRQSSLGPRAGEMDSSIKALSFVLWEPLVTCNLCLMKGVLTIDEIAGERNKNMSMYKKKIFFSLFLYSTTYLPT